jgi:hypothetical protein
MRSRDVTLDVLRALIAIEVLLVIGHVIDDYALDGRVLLVTTESNVPTWFSSTQFVLAALACLWVGRTDRASTGARAWLLLALVFAFFSFDEIATIHERLESHGSKDVWQFVIEPIIGLVVIAIFYRAIQSAPARSKRFLTIAIATLILSQACSAAASKLYGEDGSGAGFDTLAILEEVFKFLTGTFGLVGALDAGASELLELPARASEST